MTKREKKLTILAFLLIINASLCGQSVKNIINGLVQDRNTQTPIPYSAIGDLNKRYGYYSDSSGVFTLFYISNYDSVKISCIGYKSLLYNISELQQKPIIFLEKNQRQSNEFIPNFKINKAREIELGYISSFVIGQMGIIYPINILGVYIPFPEGVRDALIKSVKFPYHVENEFNPVRIRILEVKSNGEPGEDLLDENVIFSNFKKGNNRVAMVDISSFNLHMNKLGVFVALEWLQNTVPVELRIRPGIMGPSINLINKTEFTPNSWIGSYNSSKWSEVNVDKIPSFGITVVDCSILGK
jgi:hypothetical protein